MASKKTNSSSTGATGDRSTAKTRAARDPSSSTLNRQIDDNLKRAFDATVNEELPDRFMNLIAQLREKDGTGSHER